VRQLPPTKRLIKLVGRFTFWWMSRTAGLLRPWSVTLLGNALGSVFFALSRRYREVALRNLRAAYGHEMGEEEIRRAAKAVFRHFSRGAFEFFYLLSLSGRQVDAMMDLEGVEHLDRALSLGKGCIAITAHYGNWELFARKMALLGYKMNVIARDSDDPGMTGIATRIRESGGYRVFDRDQPIIGAFRCLRNNEILAILPDQNEIDGILVPFFGRLAATASGPAVLSLKSGAPIVPGFAVRNSDGTYTGRIYPPLEFEPTGDEDRDVRELTAMVTAAIEQEIRRNPTQWLWLHDRWKYSPEGEGLVH